MSGNEIRIADTATDSRCRLQFWSELIMMTITIADPDFNFLHSIGNRSVTNCKRHTKPHWIPLNFPELPRLAQTPLTEIWGTRGERISLKQIQKCLINSALVEGILQVEAHTPCSNNITCVLLRCGSYLFSFLIGKCRKSSRENSTAFQGEKCHIFHKCRPIAKRCCDFWKRSSSQSRTLNFDPHLNIFEGKEQK